MSCPACYCVSSLAISLGLGGGCRWHNSILPERWREWVIVLCVCVCVCVWQTERLRTNECTALCCRSTVFFLHLCRTLTASGRALLPTNRAVTSVTHERPLPGQPVCVRASQSNYRRIPGQWASLCMQSHTVSQRYHSFGLFVAYPSLIITAFSKSYSSYGNCIRKDTVCTNSRFA